MQTSWRKKRCDTPAAVHCATLPWCVIRAALPGAGECPGPLSPVTSVSEAGCRL